MSRRFEELDWQQTPMGEISLRRRLEPTLRVDVYEVKLGEEFLMSSLFTGGRDRAGPPRAGRRPRRRTLDVVVGGLGLGYTAVTALEDDRVRSMTVVEALPAVIDWHERRLLPDVAGLAGDPRHPARARRLLRPRRGRQGFGHGRARSASTRSCSTSTTRPGTCCTRATRRSTPPTGLRALRRLLHPGGVFALWSDDPPDEAFLGCCAPSSRRRTGTSCPSPTP